MIRINRDIHIFMHISVYARWSVEKRITDADDDDDDDVSESAREKAADTHTDPNVERNR